ncbi:MAG: SAF domain-containing protein [Methanobacterium sp. ERen5]|nr:MAG: SAF domain-containing protein [Methanobacterium sp. ERen5]
MISAARRSIFVDEVINEGDIISEDTLKVLRPEIGIKPKYLEFITGRISRKNLSKENPVKWDDVE